MWYRYVPGRNGFLRPFPRICPFRRRHVLGYQQIPLADRNVPQVADEIRHFVPPTNEGLYWASLEDEEHLVDVNTAFVALAAAQGIVRPRVRCPVESPRPPHSYLPEFRPGERNPSIAAFTPQIPDESAEPEIRHFNALLEGMEVQNIIHSRLSIRARPN